MCIELDKKTSIAEGIIKSTHVIILRGNCYGVESVKTLAVDESDVCVKIITQ